MRIGIAESIEEYQDYYRAIDNFFKDFIGFYPTPKNAVLIMFYTYDKKILIKNDATVWKEKRKADPKPPPPVPASINVLENVDLNTKRVYGYVAAIIDGIVDNGHPQLRTAAKLLGGFSSFYNLSLSDVEHWIHSKIDFHPYLRKGISGYKKTASEFIINGALEPTSFPD